MTDQREAPHCRHSELAVGWALHVLEPAEEILVAAHLPDCAQCRGIVADTELVGATLGLAIPQQSPSAELTQRVLEVTSAAQIPPESPSAPASPVPPPIPRSAPPTAVHPPRTPPLAAPRPTPRPRRRRDPLCVPELLKLILVALLIFIVAVAMVFIVLP